MTYDEAVSVITVMMAAWPSTQKMSNDTAALWTYDLQQLDYEPAMDALNRMRHTDEFAPNLARFLGAYQAVAPRTFHEAIGPGKAEKSVVTPVIAALKDAVKKASRSDHANHHLQPHKDCPVCSQHDHLYQHGRWTHIEQCARCRELGLIAYEAFKQSEHA